MIRRRILLFFAWFSLFGASLALIHMFLLLSLSSSITGAAIGSGSAPFLGVFAFLLLFIAFLFFMIAMRRVLSRPVLRRIAFLDLHHLPFQFHNDIFK